MDIPLLNDALEHNVVQVKIPDSETYNKILNDMVIAFMGKNKHCTTEAATEKYCRKKLNSAITGFKPDGSPWRNAPGKFDDDWYDILRKRLRMLRYDVDKKKYISNNRSVTGAIKALKKEYSKKKKAEVTKEFEETEEELNKMLTLREKALLEEFKKQFRKDFPVSTTIIDDLMMTRLGMMYILSLRDYNNLEITNGLTNEIIKLSESLGLSGKQRISQLDQDRSGTLNQLVEIYNETKNSFIDIEKEYKMEELKLIVNAIERGTLDEFLGMDYVRRLYGDYLNGKPVTFNALKKYVENWIRESNEQNPEE